MISELPYTFSHGSVWTGDVLGAEVANIVCVMLGI